MRLIFVDKLGKLGGSSLISMDVGGKFVVEKRLQLRTQALTQDD